MRRTTLLLMVVLRLFLLEPAPTSADADSDLAVIVNKKTAIPALTSRDLRNILLGEQSQWPDGQSVQAASLSLDAPETKLVLKQICGMSGGDFKRYFMQLAFQGRAATPPRIMPNAAAVKALVRLNPGGLGIIRAGDVDPSVTVIPLDGMKPGTIHYKLAMAH